MAVDDGNNFYLYLSSLFYFQTCFSPFAATLKFNFSSYAWMKKLLLPFVHFISDLLPFIRKLFASFLACRLLSLEAFNVGVLESYTLKWNAFVVSFFECSTFSPQKFHSDFSHQWSSRAKCSNDTIVVEWKKYFSSKNILFPLYDLRQTIYNRIILKYDIIMYFFLFSLRA